ncbi:YvrJ family protein [Sporosarcina sp. FSL K6-3457]
MSFFIFILQEVGFPIFVSFYLLHRLESKLIVIHDAHVLLKMK